MYNEVFLFFQENVFTVHVYVKEIKKDYVKVQYEPRSLTIQFQTLWVVSKVW